MSGNIQHDREKTNNTIASVKAKTEEILGTEIPAQYDKILNGIDKNEGYFTECLKDGIQAEKMTVESIRIFLLTLLEMMDNASVSLDETEQGFASQKVH